MATDTWIRHGTSIVGTSSGGDFTFDMANVSNNVGKTSNEYDWGTGDLPTDIAVHFELEMDANPTDGSIITLAFLWSNDGSDYPCEYTGTGGTFSDDARLKVLPYDQKWIMTQDDSIGDKVVRQGIIPCVNRYLGLWLMNESGQSTASSGTVSRAILTPRYYYTDTV